MVNNKTQKTTATTATVSESNIYVKQSDLDKMTLGSFRNDVGYISSSALSAWMKEHSYLSKSEITALINKANLVVIDSINKEYDEDAIARLNEDIADVKGEIVAIKDKLREIDGDYIKVDKESSLASKTYVDARVNTQTSTINSKFENINNQITRLGNTISSMDFAKEDDIPTKVSQLENDKNFITNQALTGYVKTSTLKDYVKSSDLPTVPDITGLAEKSEIPTKVSQLENDKGYITKQALNGYAKESTLKGYMKQEDVVDLINSAEQIDLDKFAQKSDLNKLGSTVSSISKSLGNYATKAEISKFITLEDLNIPSTDGLASREWVEGQRYLKEGSLSGLVKKSELSTYAKTSQIKDMATKDWVENTIAELVNDGGDPIDFGQFAKVSQIPKDYVSTTAIKQYVKTSQISDMATRSWVEEQGFLKSVPDMSGDYATKAELSKYVSKSSLSSTLRSYVKSGNVYTKNETDNKFLTDTKAGEKYLQKSDAGNIYLTKTEANDYLKIEDYQGLKEMVINKEILKDALVINGSYSSMAQLEANLPNLVNGFYVIGSDLVIVKEHSILGTIEGGVPQQKDLVWEEE